KRPCALRPQADGAAEYRVRSAFAEALRIQHRQDVGGDVQGVGRGQERPGAHDAIRLARMEACSAAGARCRSGRGGGPAVEQPATLAGEETCVSRHDRHEGLPAEKVHRSRLSKTESVAAKSSITAPISQNPASTSNRATWARRC